jgi:hypothetical protein
LLSIYLKLFVVRGRWRYRNGFEVVRRPKQPIDP